jgi:hypothetical protein
VPIGGRATGDGQPPRYGDCAPPEARQILWLRRVRRQPFRLRVFALGVGVAASSCEIADARGQIGVSAMQVCSVPARLSDRRAPRYN